MVQRLLLLPQRYEFSSKSQPIRPLLLMMGSCCCYRKGTNFQANHNSAVLINNGYIVVVATAKVRIFKQITTPVRAASRDEVLLLLPQRYEFSSKSQLCSTSDRFMLGCCCYRKGTNFQANHNHAATRGRERSVVVATAKVRIFKQITTGLAMVGVSQRCCCYRKGTNFQANHNQFKHDVPRIVVVVATAKVRIFKQITTRPVNLFHAIALLLLPQRYEFSSKSQLEHVKSAAAQCCCCYRKGTNFQANHNS